MATLNVKIEIDRPGARGTLSGREVKQLKELALSRNQCVRTVVSTLIKREVANNHVGN